MNLVKAGSMLGTRLTKPVREDWYPDSHIPALDGLRGIAAMTVLVSHCATAGLLLTFLNSGQMGVGLFFILSGFLMGHLYARQDFASNAVRFIRGRVARILPLYVAVVVLSLMLSSTAIWTFPVQSPQKLANHLLFLKGDYTLWTIAVEVQFYALFLVLWVAFSKGQFLKTVAALIALQAFMAAVFFAAEVPDEKLPFWLHFFLLGTLTALWRSQAGETSNHLETSKYKGLLGWGALCFTFLSFPGLRLAAGLPVLPNWGDPLTVAAPVILFLAALGGVPALQFLTSICARKLGRISYGIYLLHFPILMTLKDLPTPGFVTAAIVTAITLVAAVASFHLFELPLAKLIGARPRPEAGPVADTRHVLHEAQA